MVIWVSWVMRRFSGLSLTTETPSWVPETSMTVTPWMFFSIMTSSALAGVPAEAAGRLILGLAYSEFTTMTWRPSTSNVSIPSVFSPKTLSDMATERPGSSL